ncbi:flavin reductase family protein [Bacillus sp. H-16]|uniref:flavin reductase family protein n=1 Tax=Alteribacter salitolerans TaxID=2912333 RepID=UPI001963F162|nr:flavin reductase family protein [Alteribacter salitolerans]MBM7096789.1 flavin reductase family protein [Alteribacter salitolerans]
MLKSTDQTVMHSYPGLVALVTAKHEHTQNIMAAGWHSYISFAPPIYGVAVAEERFTHHLMKASGSFAVNFVPAEFAAYIDGAGKHTGKDGDKFKALGIEWKPGETIDAPVLKEAYVAYECSIIDINRYGDHDWFVGKMTKFHRDDTKFGPDRLPDFEKIKLPLYLGRSQYLIADERTSILKLKK